MTAGGIDAAGVSRPATGHSWRITSGSPTAEEVAAVAVALSTVLAARASRGRETGPGSPSGARWSPFAAGHGAATSWAASSRPGWRGAA
ncbi:hypothetical protein AB0F77_31705 [Streptomyces sp. NPDC026672]|uniref:hypothetical protein n=1 Tax=unclassified Streptomyces TaxID=2593676 RepID=UPI0033FEB2FB